MGAWIRHLLVLRMLEKLHSPLYINKHVVLKHLFDHSLEIVQVKLIMELLIFFGGLVLKSFYLDVFYNLVLRSTNMENRLYILDVAIQLLLISWAT